MLNVQDLIAVIGLLNAAMYLPAVHFMISVSNRLARIETTLEIHCNGGVYGK